MMRGRGCRVYRRRWRTGEKRKVENEETRCKTGGKKQDKFKGGEWAG